MSYGPRQRKPRNHSLSFRSWFDDPDDPENLESDDQNSGFEPPDAGTTASPAAKPERFDPFAEPAAATREPRRPRTGLSLNEPDWASEPEADTAPEAPRHRQPFAGGAMRATARPTASEQKPEPKPKPGIVARLAEQAEALLKPAARPKAPAAARQSTPRPSPHPEAIPHRPAAQDPPEVEDRPPTDGRFLSGPRGPSHQSRIRLPRSMPGSPAAAGPDAPRPEQPANGLDLAPRHKLFPDLPAKTLPAQEQPPKPPQRRPGAYPFVQNLPYRLPDDPIDAEDLEEPAVIRPGDQAQPHTIEPGRDRWTQIVDAGDATGQMTDAPPVWDGGAIGAKPENTAPYRAPPPASGDPRQIDPSPLQMPKRSENKMTHAGPDWIPRVNEEPRSIMRLPDTPPELTPLPDRTFPILDFDATIREPGKIGIAHPRLGNVLIDIPTQVIKDYDPDEAATYHEYDHIELLYEGGDYDRQKMWEAFLSFPAPGASGSPISDNDQGDAWDPIIGQIGGGIRHRVLPEHATLTNTTEPEHDFHDGAVQRTLIFTDLGVFVYTMGKGNNLYGTLIDDFNESPLIVNGTWNGVNAAVRKRYGEITRQP